MKRLLLLLLLAVLLLSGLALFGQATELPDAPSAHVKAPRWDFYLTWGVYGSAVAVDGLASSRWAGTGPHPCALEATARYAYPNGKFRSGRFARDNALIYGGLFTLNYIIRRKAPKHWAYRLFTDATPIALTGPRIAVLTRWYQLCH